MNRKGFTLVELLAVIIVLGLLMTLMASNVFKGKNSAAEGIGKQEEKALTEAAKMYAIDMDDPYSDVFINADCSTKQCADNQRRNGFNNVYGELKTCEVEKYDIGSDANGNKRSVCRFSSVYVSLEALKNMRYFSDPNDHCKEIPDSDAYIHITRDSNNQDSYEITITNITCTK